MHSHAEEKRRWSSAGNAPFIVFNDADIDSAVQGALVSKYRNSGPNVRLFKPVAGSSVGRGGVYPKNWSAETAKLTLG